MNRQIILPSEERASPTSNHQPWIVWFDKIQLNDVPLVGGKNASLGEMIQNLSAQGVKVPNGFAITAFAYRQFITTAGLEQKLHNIFANLDAHNIDAVSRQSNLAQALILEASFPTELEDAIRGAYRQLCARYNDDVDVAVRSSATAEDLPDASFAGQQESYLNVRGEEALLESCQKCFASLFTARAVSYRQVKGFDHLAVDLSIGVQKMVRSDLACSGVMFSIDPETGFRDAVLISAAYGLGENVVQGTVNPDEYVVFKPTLSQGFHAILRKRLGSKQQKLVYDSSNAKPTKNEIVPMGARQRFALDEGEILQLARWACTIEKHYSQAYQTYTPMDIEWAKDGMTGELFIVQARPETVQSQKTQNVLRSYQLQVRSEVLVTGRSVGDGIGQGKVRVIRDLKDIERFQQGEILVADRTDPDWELLMQKSSAIVTNRGGRVCHAAIVARELGIPAIVGTNNGTEILKTGEDITVSCAEGEEGRVYKSLLPFQINETLLEHLPRPRTQLMMNVGNPDEAFRLAAIPNDGVSLARLEFIIANYIKIHPLALLHYPNLRTSEGNVDVALCETLEQLTIGYEDKPQYFVDKLAEGVSTIAAAFYPKPVIVRLSDFKSNEYANLLGGSLFEPQEENPMLGWRGACRYYDERYRAGFGLECQALKRVRDEMGLTNVILMVPFCRTPKEGRAVLAEMAKSGLIQGKNGLQVYVMCELPSNVLLAEKFAEVFDGFSIGSNDLTQLTLGLDRDSALVAHLFDERNEAVKCTIAMAIAAAKKNGRKIGLCGQAPSDYPEFARFLVEQGIDSIGLNPDSILKTLLQISEIENNANVLK
ncbi:MAG: phosphoenolpyruvate synthase [Hydrococcus sp. RU_2_2]|nr:phosphoenolpyruvate synthase [Hydrococcus sp. RU_2_2]NJP19149.1 phosphoenolpyruvate synthase [Hydrococcus sp. CRU_1_1]